jgi:hypothetical protein
MKESTGKEEVQEEEETQEEVQEEVQVVKLPPPKLSRRSKAQSKRDIKRFEDEVIQIVTTLDKVPAAEILYKQLEQLRLSEELQTKVEIIRDAENGVYYLETEIPPAVSYDEDTGKLRCQDASLAYMIQLVTNGEPKKIKWLLSSPGKMRARILADNTGWIKIRLLAKALYEAMHQSLRDPHKFVLDLLAQQQPKKRPKKGTPKTREQLVEEKLPETGEARGQSAQKIAKDIERVANAGPRDGEAEV